MQTERPRQHAVEPLPYDPPTSSLNLRPTSSNQMTTNQSPVSVQTPTETPHDLFCLAREYDRTGRKYDAANLYLKASLNGHLNAMVAYAKHLSTTDQRNAFVWYRAAAERGDSRAWAELGQLLASGRYFEPNAVDAARCWKRAAQMGDNKGKCCLGLCYIRGYGVRQDADKGLEIVTQVADVHNDVTAMRNLSWIYRTGTDVPKNSKLAEYWHNRAKTQQQKMMKLSSREHVLYGRSKSSRSNTKDPASASQPTTTTPTTTPTHTTAAAAAAAASANAAAVVADPTTATVPPPASADNTSQYYPVEPAPESRYQASDANILESNANALDEEDVQSRLQGVAQDSLRQSAETAGVKLADTDEVITSIGEERSIQTNLTTSAATHEKTSQSEVPTVLTTSAILAGDSFVEETQPTASVLDSDRYEHLDKVRKDPDPLLGAEVAKINFVEKSESDQADIFPTQDLGISQEEVVAVQETAALKASKQGQLLEATAPAPQQVSVRNVQEQVLSPRRSLSPTNESGDDNFQTPEESLEDEQTDAPVKSSAVAAGVLGAGAGVAATGAAFAYKADEGTDIGLGGGPTVSTAQKVTESYTRRASDARENLERSLRQGDEAVNESEEEYYDESNDAAERELREHYEDEEEHFEDTVPYPPTTGTGSATGPIAEATAASYSAGDVENNPEIADTEALHQSYEGLEPGVRSKAMFFETQAAKEEAERFDGHQQSPSYSLNGIQSGTVEQRSADIDEFEKNDVLQASQAMHIGRSDISPSQSYTPSYSQSRSATKGTEHSSEGLTVRSRAFGYENQIVSTAELENILSSYPENPMRRNSRLTLYHFLVNVQGFSVSSPEVFDVLQKGSALPKVILGMVSQPEDHAIQEQGLHAFIRMMRATQGPTRENLVTMTFGDCYRKVQNKPDAVVPKGKVGLDEDMSGAIQAISLAMRSHSEIRRVQLSGCAALAEVAAVSGPCRTIAYENGAVSLVLGCLRHRSTKAAATIHDVGARTVSAFCAGKENYLFKEAFTNAGAVPELLNVLRMWGHSEDERSELTTTVVKSTCVALRYITDSCAVASAQCVQSYAYHHLIRVMVLYREDVSVCTIVVSTLSTVTRNGGAFAEKGLLDAKPLREVLVTMQRHSDNPLFIRKCLDFMDALANFGPMRGELVDEGSIPFAAGIIAQNSNDTLLLERACSVVEKLCRGSQRNQDVFGSSDGVRSLINLLKAQQGLPGIAERDLMATASVCSNNPDNQHEAMKSGAPDVLTRVMNAYTSKNGKVVAAAASAMGALLTPKNPSAAHEFSEMQSPDFVVRAMKKHTDSMSVQEHGSTALATFCESDPRIITTLLKSGVSSILVIALQRFLHKQSAVVQIARAMRAITNEANPDASYRFKTKLLTDRSNESSLPEIFHTALSYHKKSLPESANVVISICATINRLCMRSVTFKNEVGKDGIVEELKRLVEKTADFHEIGALQPVLATICTLVLDSEDNKNRFHEVGGVEAILEVMQKWRSDTYVLEHCCAALRYSCNDHYGNCIEVKNHNGVRSITGVMTRHSQNVNVMMWCCLTLADLCKGDEDVQSSRQVIEGIRRVISAMTTFADNRRFLAAACEFLRAASLDHEDNQDRIVRLGGRTAIIKSLESHPEDSNLTESGSYALIQIQDITDPRSSMDGGSGGRLNLVQRFSREMRRSSSAKSKDSGKSGGIGRKSFSFSRRKAARAQEEDVQPLIQTVAVENPATRPNPFKFSKGSRYRRKRKGKPEIEELPDEDVLQEHVEEGYDELPSAVEEREIPARQLD